MIRLGLVLSFGTLALLSGTTLEQSSQRRFEDQERALGGLVTAEQLRPDVRWVRIPDESWPHPAGRPLIDVAAPAAEEAPHAA